jgi:hypothetical protein
MILDEGPHADWAVRKILAFCILLGLLALAIWLVP